MAAVEIDPELKQAQALLFKAKLYKYFARVLGVLGIVILLVTYSKLSAGNVFYFVERPLVFLIFPIPLIPSFVLYLMSQRNRTACIKMVGKKKEEFELLEKGTRKRTELFSKDRLEI